MAEHVAKVRSPLGSLFILVCFHS